ncbi:MAG: M1 family metallopeptidase [Saprospiraceae bacterium]
MMQRIHFSVLIIFLWSGFLSAQPLSSRVASYDIAVTLDTESRLLQGQEKLYWKNPSADTIHELRFHLYWNAFSNTETTFLNTEGRIGSLPEANPGEVVWGWNTINKMTDPAGNDLTQNMEYIAPDDNNEFDQTVLRVPLVEPVLPFDSTTISIDFTNKIPKIIARAGYTRDYYFMVHWFPKIGVYEPAGMRYSDGAWNCHQFHPETEFYADFGVYNVAITVPNEYIIGASGVEVEQETEGSQTTYRYHLADAIDFAWTAYPSFLIEKRKWKNIELKLMYDAAHEHLVERYFAAMEHSLAFLDEFVGAYPYPVLTLVSPPIFGVRSSGMEYSTLVTGASTYPMPEGIRTPEIIAAHEITHQYFQQLVATNEMEEAFMDEGFTSYYESRIMDHFYGEKASTFNILGFRAGGMEEQRHGYLAMPNPKIIANFPPGWQAKHGGARTVAYNKTATWLRTLEGLVGRDCMDQIMQTYFADWKYGHPAAPDFIKVVNQVVKSCHGERFGTDMNWFFNQVMYGTDVCDYSIVAIQNNPRQAAYGAFNDGQEIIEKSVEEALESDSTVYDSRVIINRLGELQFPLEVEIRFADGTTKMEKWDGQARSHEFSYTGTNRIIAAYLDPNENIYMDKNFLNNSRTLEPETSAIWKYVSKFMTYLQHTLQTVAMLI